MQDPWVVGKNFGSFSSNFFTQPFRYFQIVNLADCLSSWYKFVINNPSNIKKKSSTFFWPLICCMLEVTCLSCTYLSNIHSFISIQPWTPSLVGTRAQSCDRYGSGTLHPRQVLGGRLPLLSPAFRPSHFSRQVPLSATTREILAAKSGTVGEKDFR